MLLPAKDDEGNPIEVVKVCDFGIAKIVEPDVDAGGRGHPHGHAHRHAHGARNAHRNARVHVARAGPRRAGRRAQRHLLAGGHPVPAAGRAASLHRDEQDPPRHQARGGATAAAERGRFEGGPGARSDLHEGPGEAARRSLPGGARDACGAEGGAGGRRGPEAETDAEQSAADESLEQLVEGRHHEDERAASAGASTAAARVAPSIRGPSAPRGAGRRHQHQHHGRPRRCGGRAGRGPQAAQRAAATSHSSRSRRRRGDVPPSAGPQAAPDRRASAPIGIILGVLALIAVIAYFAMR